MSLSYILLCNSLALSGIQSIFAMEALWDNRHFDWESNWAKESRWVGTYSLPPDETDKCQPVVQREGYLLKTLMGNELDKYLVKKDNLEKWQSVLTASEGRILLT